MTPTEIAAMQADALAGTRGDWTDKCDEAHFGPQSIVVAGERSRKYGVNDQMIVHVGGWSGLTQQEANTRRIARVPRMEAAITAQAAEISALVEQTVADQNRMQSLVDDVEKIRDALHKTIAAGNLRDVYHLMRNDKAAIGSGKSPKCRARDMWLKAFGRAVIAARAALEPKP